MTILDGSGLPGATPETDHRGEGCVLCRCMVNGYEGETDKWRQVEPMTSSELDK